MEPIPANPASLTPASVDPVVESKVAMAAKALPVLSSAASALKAAQNDDPVKLAADALQLGADTLATHASAAASLSGSSALLRGLTNVVKGDTYGAAAAMSLAADKLAPRIASKGLGALAAAWLLNSGDEKVKSQVVQVGKHVQTIIEPRASGAQRAKAAVDAGVGLVDLAVVARTLCVSVLAIARFALKLAGRSDWLAPTANSLLSAAGEMAKTPGGRWLGNMNRILPALNVAGVAISAKTMIDVFRQPHASSLSKVLSISSLATAGIALWAGFSLPALPFLIIIATSIGLDFWLAASRQRDAKPQPADKANTPPTTVSRPQRNIQGRRLSVV
ncbi:MAG: hypothetical protein VKP62_03700 [Candidatus Sericytochromatia bacterium]|nr:hypothetical protein [Candidatus Sericytochromatia bacterium]